MATKVKKFSLGFTLIEILIAISIVVILTTIGIASYNSSSQANATRVQAQELVSLARKVRNDGISGTKPATCTSTLYGTFLSFAVVPGGSNNYYYGTACFDGSGTPSITTNQITLPTGIKIGTIGGSNNYLIIFFAFDGKVWWNNSLTITPDWSSFIKLLPTNPGATYALIGVNPRTVALIGSTTIPVAFSSSGLICISANFINGYPCAN